MVAVKQLNVLVLTIMIAISVLNLGLTFNFAAASGAAFAAIFSTETIFLIAAIELAAVLLAYIVYKQQSFPAQA
jgi:lipoprotein signal peptidase